MSADIDIDFANREDILKLIRHTPARQSNGQKQNVNKNKKLHVVPNWILLCVTH